MARRARLNVLALVLLVCAPLSLSGGAQELLPPPILPPPPLSPPLTLDAILRDRALSGTGQSHVIVRAQDAASVSALVPLIQEVGGTPGRELTLLDAVAAQVPNASLITLGSNPVVRRVALDRITLGLMARTSAVTGAAAVRETYGYDGLGVGVAVIDSGVTSWHDDLGRAGVPGSQRVARFVDFVGWQETPYDGYGHGTHVAGIIAGNGANSGGRRAGMAPSAHLVALKVLDGNGRGRISSVIAALDYAITYRYELNIRVVNLSVSAAVVESYNDDFLALATKRAVEAGLVVVAAGGNSGRAPDGRTLYASITAPGNAPWVLTVGAASHMGTTDPSDDTIAPFSSRGPSPIDYTAKPDLVAPGVGIVSLADPASAMFSSHSAYLINGTGSTWQAPYLSLTGTSQAAPIVTGAVALMLQANPALSPNEVKAILQYTAKDHPGYGELVEGAGSLNTLGAVNLARFFAAPSIEGYPSTTGWSGVLHWGNQRVKDGWLTPQRSAWQSSVMWGAPSTPDGQSAQWGITCSGDACYQPATSWNGWGCTDAACDTVVWDDGRAVNIVWGTTCGGADCQGTAWRAPPNTTSVLVWAGSDGETIVWGTTDAGETIVWGTTYDDPSRTPVIWEE